MRGSHEKHEPPELVAWLALKSPDWQPAYPFPSDIRPAVVEALRQAQRGLCVYCGRRLQFGQRGRFHIEHFRPRSARPDLSLDLANLFLSCGPESPAGTPSETCGRAKADWFDEAKCVEPDYPTCTRRFRLMLTGSLTPRSDGDTAAGTMIKALNLNHAELRKDRRDILELVDGGGLDLSDFVDPESGAAQSYAHLICERFGAVIP